MKRFIFIILALFLILTTANVDAAQNITTKEIHTIAQDGFNLKATLSYKKEKGRKEYPTVILLHSLGYSSQWWGNLPEELINKGFAVLEIDFRGHGQSIYNAKLTKISWKNLKDSAYEKYPDDVIRVMKTVKEENPKVNFFNKLTFIGSDIGASTAIITADKLPVKPPIIVLISPVTKTKGIYVPIHVANLDNTDFLSIVGTNDTTAIEASAYIKKFAQNKFAQYISESNASGMVLLKNDPQITTIICDWISEYFN